MSIDKMYLMKVREKFQVTIPKEIREYLDIEVGDYVLFVREDDMVFLEKADVVIGRKEE